MQVTTYLSFNGLPLEKTFWTERFGMVVDRFAVPWMINCEAADPSG